MLVRRRNRTGQRLKYLGMSFGIHPILVNDGVVGNSIRVAGGDAVTWGQPKHGHNSRIVSSSGSLLGWGNISIRRRGNLLEKQNS